MLAKHKTTLPTMVFMRLITWQRDSHGLFDYESRSVDRFEYKSTAEGYITRRNVAAEDNSAQVSA